MRIYYRLTTGLQVTEECLVSGTGMMVLLLLWMVNCDINIDIVLWWWMGGGLAT